ncbi:MAG: M23 family metallopeptidase [Clostridia bacterium]|nr:M23 family metallopeptidase [Clostridia bacterium]
MLSWLPLAVVRISRMAQRACALTDKEELFTINILNAMAAIAASALARKNTQPDPVSDAVIRPMYWLYRNCCYFGMQMERYARRYWRKLKKLFRPLGLLVNRLWTKIKNKAVGFAGSVSAIWSDIRTNTKTIGTIKEKNGFAAGTRAFFRAIPRAVTKHKGFCETVVNYTLPIICVALLLFVIVDKFEQNYALEVECDGVVVGYIADESVYTDATELVGERIVFSSDGFQQTISPTYSLAAIEPDQLTDADAICENILYNSDDVAEAYGFFIDDNLIAAVESEGDLTFILEDFLEKYRIGQANEKMSFIGTPKTVYGLYAVEKIISSEEFKEKINSEEYTSQVYTIRRSDTLSGILRKFGMTEERFYELNTGFNGELVAGNTVVIEKLQPVLRVKSVVVSSYEKDIAYSTVTEKDPSLYVGTTKVKVQGVNGKQRVTQEITYVDGVETSRTVTNRETLKEPVNKVVLVGSKATTTRKHTSGNFTQSAPADTSNMGTGRFTWPVPGVRHVSSYYGYRWGRLHKGIDISTSGVYGRTIVAADTGTVTTVKRTSGGYGLHVIVSHSNGYTTLYAHCSAVMVSAGQRVSKGQAIAKVGNSGNSTGPHLHFEIRKNGSATNPMNYY